MQEIAAICCVDLCKAATFISPNEDSVLRHIAADIEDVLYEKVWDLSRPLVFENISASLGYTINYQALLNDYFMARLRLAPSHCIKQLVQCSLALFCSDRCQPLPLEGRTIISGGYGHEERLRQFLQSHGESPLMMALLKTTPFQL